MAQRSYQVGNVVFGIRTTSAEFCQWLDRTLTAYRIEEQMDPYYSIVIAGGKDEQQAGTRGYHLLYKGSHAVVRTLHLPSLGRALLTEIESLTFPERDDLLYLSFGLVAWNGATALLPSSLVTFVSGQGRRAGRAGIHLPANGTVAVDPESGQVTSIPSTLDVPGGAVEELDGQVSEPDRIFVDGPVTPDVLFTFAQGEAPYEPASRAQLLTRLAASVYNLKRVGRTALEGLSRTVDGASCYAIRGADAKVVVQALADVLRSA